MSDKRKRPGLWARLHSRIPDDPKILALLDESKGLEAAAVYVFSIAWCKENATDGKLPKGVLRRIHGTRRHAELLVQVGLWQSVDAGGLRIPEQTWRAWQDTAEEVEQAQQARREAGHRTACRRWHPQPCRDPECPASDAGNVLQLEVKGDG